MLLVLLFCSPNCERLNYICTLRNVTNPCLVRLSTQYQGHISFAKDFDHCIHRVCVETLILYTMDKFGPKAKVSNFLSSNLSKSSTCSMCIDRHIDNGNRYQIIKIPTKFLVQTHQMLQASKAMRFSFH